MGHLMREMERVEFCGACGGRDLSPFDDTSSLLRCADCGLVLDSPRPTDEALVEFYSRDGQYSDWLRDEHARQALWSRRLRKILRNRKPGSLLDVGAGIGQLLHLAEPHFANVYGTEISAAAIAVARDKYDLTLFRGALSDVDLKLGVDNITMFHVLEHVRNPRETLETCRSLLTSGGMLYIAVPNELDSLNRRVKRRLAKAGVRRYQRIGSYQIPEIDLTGANGTEVHLSHFTEASLRSLLHRTGFEVIEMGFDPYSVARGRRRLVDKVSLFTAIIMRLATRQNVYDAIWVAARKK